MKGSVIACLLMPSGGLLVGQEVPMSDVFLGYSFVRYNSALSVPTCTATGGLGGFSCWNFNNHIAGEAGERGGQSMAQNDDTAKLLRVEVWFVPANGQPPSDSSDSKAAVAAGVEALGCPR